MPRGLRRGEPKDPAVGSTIGSTEITKPLDQPDLATGHAFPHGSSNDAASHSVGMFEDTADQAKPNHPPPHPGGPPFTLTK